MVLANIQRVYRGLLVRVDEGVGAEKAVSVLLCRLESMVWTSPFRLSAAKRA